MRNWMVEESPNADDKKILKLGGQQLKECLMKPIINTDVQAYAGLDAVIELAH